MTSIDRGRFGPTWAVFRSSPAFCRLYMASLISQLGDGGMLIAFPLLIGAPGRAQLLGGASPLRAR